MRFPMQFLDTMRSSADAAGPCSSGGSSAGRRCGWRAGSGWHGAVQHPPVQAPHLSVALISARDGIFLVVAAGGLYFKLDKGWHVYWSNAGDSGEPPKIKLDAASRELPPIRCQFPVPQHLPLGPLMDYGYENEVVFPILLHADPTRLKLGNSAGGLAPRSIGWSAARSCIPGKAELKLPMYRC